MKLSTFRTCIGTAATALCLCLVTGQQAQAGTLYSNWTYSIDSFNDGTEGHTIGEKSQFEFYGMAFQETHNRVYFAINSNLSLNSYASSGARNGKISYGDLFLNFANPSKFDDANSKNQLFAIRFDGTNDTTLNLGLYGDVKATSLTTKNSGYSSIQSHTNTIDQIHAETAQKYNAAVSKYETAVQNLSKTTQQRTETAQKRDDTARSYDEAVHTYDKAIQQKNEAVQSYDLAIQQKNDATLKYQDAVRKKQDATLLKQEVSRLTQEVATRKQEVTRLTQEVTTRKQQMDQLNRSLTTLDRSLTTLDQSLTKLNQDVAKLNAEKEALDPAKIEASFGDLAVTSSYFNTQAAAPTTIASGTFLGAISRLTGTDLEKMGLDFSHFGTRGQYTFGFSVDKSLLPQDSFIASLFAECGNDGVSLNGELKGVPEPSMFAGLTVVGVLMGGSQLRRRQRSIA